MARPIKQIDWAALDKLCGIQCTLEEIASFFEVSDDTIERAVKREKKMRFAEYFQQKRNDGRISLRRVQYQKALGGNITMLIWLGKQYLNQTDKFDQKNSIDLVKSELSDAELKTRYEMIKQKIKAEN